VSNESCEKVKFSILNRETDKKISVTDSSSKKKSNTVIEGDNLPLELSKRMDEHNFSSEPLHIMCESKYFINMVIIDTPGLPANASSDEHSQVRNEFT
jgi:hypothetical protein